MRHDLAVDFLERDLSNLSDEKTVFDHEDASIYLRTTNVSHAPKSVFLPQDLDKFQVGTAAHAVTQNVRLELQMLASKALLKMKLGILEPGSAEWQAYTALYGHKMISYHKVDGDQARFPMPANSTGVAGAGSAALSLLLPIKLQDKQTFAELKKLHERLVSVGEDRELKLKAEERRLLRRWEAWRDRESLRNGGKIPPSLSYSSSDSDTESDGDGRGAFIPWKRQKTVSAMEKYDPFRTWEDDQLFDGLERQSIVSDRKLALNKEMFGVSSEDFFRLLSRRSPQAGFSDQISHLRRDIERKLTLSKIGLQIGDPKNTPRSIPAFKVWPPVQEIIQSPGRIQQAVTDFRVELVGHGSIQWERPVDLRSIQRWLEVQNGWPFVSKTLAVNSNTQTIEIFPILSQQGSSHLDTDFAFKALDESFAGRSAPSRSSQDLKNTHPLNVVGNSLLCEIKQVYPVDPGTGSPMNYTKMRGLMDCFMKEIQRESNLHGKHSPDSQLQKLTDEERLLRLPILQQLIRKLRSIPHADFITYKPSGGIWRFRIHLPLAGTIRPTELLQSTDGTEEDGSKNTSLRDSWVLGAQNRFGEIDMEINPDIGQLMAQPTKAAKAIPGFCITWPDVGGIEWSEPVDLSSLLQLAKTTTGWTSFALGNPANQGWSTCMEALKAIIKLKKPLETSNMNFASPPRLYIYPPPRSWRGNSTNGHLCSYNEMVPELQEGQTKDAEESEKRVRWPPPRYSEMRSGRELNGPARVTLYARCVQPREAWDALVEAQKTAALDTFGTAFTEGALAAMYVVGKSKTSVRAIEKHTASAYYLFRLCCVTQLECFWQNLPSAPTWQGTSQGPSWDVSTRCVFCRWQKRDIAHGNDPFCDSHCKSLAARLARVSAIGVFLLQRIGAIPSSIGINEPPMFGDNGETWAMCLFRDVDASLALGEEYDVQDFVLAKDSASSLDQDDGSPMVSGVIDLPSYPIQVNDRVLAYHNIDGALGTATDDYVKLNMGVFKTAIMRNLHCTIDFEQIHIVAVTLGDQTSNQIPEDILTDPPVQVVPEPNPSLDDLQVRLSDETFQSHLAKRPNAKRWDHLIEVPLSQIIWAARQAVVSPHILPTRARWRVQDVQGHWYVLGSQLTKVLQQHTVLRLLERISPGP